MTRKNLTVAQYLTMKINASEKSQTEIATDLGYPKPNIITMFKQGRTKLPLTKVVPLALSLELDPVHLLRVVMGEYAPETWEVLEVILGKHLISNTEKELIDIVRAAAGEEVVKPESKEEIAEFKGVVGKWKQRATTKQVVVRHQV